MNLDDRADEELYARFLAGGDEEAFRVLFERYRLPLTFFLGELTGNLYDAEELMMDCFAAVISGSARYRGEKGASFKTFLYAVAGNKAGTRRRKKRWLGSMPPEEELSVEESELPENVLLREEKNRQLYQALAGLPPDQRTVLYLKYFEEMGASEIADIMQLNIRRVYKLTEQGKVKLRELLGEDPS